MKRKIDICLKCDRFNVNGIRREHERQEFPEECVFRTEHCIDEWNDDSDDIGLQEMQLFY